MAKRTALTCTQVQGFVNTPFEGDIHAKRVLSLANATLGVMESASLAVHAIGQGLAQARGLKTKHAVKQVDRLLSNQGIDVWEYFRRSLPFLWLTVRKSQLKGARNEHEDRLLSRLNECLPEGVVVTVVADRGFADQKLLSFLNETLGFDYVIPIRSNILVTSASRQTRPAVARVGTGGRARLLRDAAITQEQSPVPTIVCIKAKGMQQAWCLASSDPRAKAADLVRLYAKRWTIETSFRDTKDLRFGMGLSATRISDPGRRDRLLLLSALAIVLLPLLGEAGERVGLDRWLKVNTVKRRPRRSTAHFAPGELTPAGRPQNPKSWCQAQDLSR